MVGRAVTKKHPKRGTRLECSVIGVRSAFGPRLASFDLAGPPVWTVDGVLGLRPLSPRALDLLDLAGAIYRVESQVPPRPTNPAREWQIVAPVRDPAFWSAEGGPRLASVLGFLSRALWTFTFIERPKFSEYEFTPVPPLAIGEVLLFSGGMDSACGAGVHPPPRDGVQLVSFYSNQRTLQQELAHELGYAQPTQWRLRGARGKEGMDLVRALMFLTLGAVVAETFGSSTIFQYENGVLAMAIPPSGSQVPTRHAHPEFHRRLERLFAAVFGRALEIRNPFALFTKREEAAQFAIAAGTDTAESVLRRTQTCWRLSQAHVGGEKKTPFVPCGVCTPCIVRRTARQREAGRGGYAFDLKKPEVREHEKLGLTFRAYLELIGIALQYSDDREMIEELAPEARSLIGGPAGPTAEHAAGVLRRFALEFCETFGIQLRSNS